MSYARTMRRLADKRAAAFPERLTPVPESEWPKTDDSAPTRFAVWRSREFLVQVYAAPAGSVRISVNRVVKGVDGRWVDGITWDELQRIKGEIGYADCWAAEYFPPAADVVNVANMRHLWLLDAAPRCAWKRTP